MEIKVTGWKAIVLILVGAIFIGYKYVSAVTTIDTDGKKAIKEWVTLEYQRYHLARKDISDNEKGQLLLKANDIKFISMSARGNLNYLAVRIEIEPNDAHPPTMPYTRYFAMKYSTITKWQHRNNISALKYYLTIF